MLMRSSVQKCTLSYFCADEGFKEEYFVAQEVLLTDMSPAVTISSRRQVEGYQKLRKQVLTRLRNPVIIILNTIENYNEAVFNVEPSFVQPYNPFKKWLVLFGNQRYTILKDEGVTKVSAFIVDKGIKAKMLAERLNE